MVFPSCSDFKPQKTADEMLPENGLVLKNDAGKIEHILDPNCCCSGPSHFIIVLHLALLFCKILAGYSSRNFAYLGACCCNTQHHLLNDCGREFLLNDFRLIVYIVNAVVLMQKVGVI